MPYEIDWRPGAIEDVCELFEYLAENSSLWNAQSVTDRILGSTEKRLNSRACTNRPRNMAKGYGASSCLGRMCFMKLTNQSRLSGFWQ